MAKRNGTAVEVDLVLIDTQDLHVGKRDNAEGLVDLESINGRKLDLGVLQSLGHGESGRGGELGGVLLSITPAKDLANGLQAMLLDGLFGGQNKGGSTIRKRRCVGGGNGTILLERRAERASLRLVELG